MQNLPVIFCLDRAGLVGEDGATHHGVYDLAYLNCIPNLIIFAPRNEVELRNIMYTAQLGLNVPITIRYPRGKGVLINWKQPFTKIEIGISLCLKEGKDIAVLSIGSIAKNVSKAIKNTTAAHYDIRFLKPLDENLLHTIFNTYSHIITVEDGTLKGGLGSAVLEFASKNKYNNDVSIMGIPDTFIHQGTIDELHKIANIDSDSISRKIKELQ